MPDAAHIELESSVVTWHKNTHSAQTQLKEVIRKLTIERAEKIAERASEIDVARDVENYLWGELKRLCPESMQLD